MCYKFPHLGGGFKMIYFALILIILLFYKIHKLDNIFKNAVSSLEEEIKNLKKELKLELEKNSEINLETRRTLTQLNTLNSKLAEQVKKLTYETELNKLKDIHGEELFSIDNLHIIDELQKRVFAD